MIVPLKDGHDEGYCARKGGTRAEECHRDKSTQSRRFHFLAHVSSRYTSDLCHSTCFASPSSIPVVGFQPTCRVSFVTSAPVASWSPLRGGWRSMIAGLPVIRSSLRSTSSTVTSSPPPRLNVSPGNACVAFTVASTQSAM